MKNIFYNDTLIFNFVLLVFLFCFMIFFTMPFLLVVLFFSLISLFFLKVNDYSFTWRIYKFIIGCFFVLYFSVVGMTIDKTGDFLEYQNIIISVISNGISFSVKGGEFLLYLYIMILNLFTSNKDIIHFILLLTSNVLLYIALYRINKGKYLLVFILLQIFSLFYITPYLTRQLLSVNLLLLALTFRHRLVFYISAFFIHTSSLIVILSIYTKIITFLDSKKNVMILIISISILSISININLFRDFLNAFVGVGFIESKANFYTHKLNISSSLDYITLILCYSVFLFKFFSVNMLKDSDKNIVNIVFVSSLICILSLNIPILYTRLGFIVIYLYPLICIVNFEINKLNLRLCYSFIILLSFLIGVYRLYLNDIGLSWLTIANNNIFDFNIFDLFKFINY